MMFDAIKFDVAMVTKEGFDRLDKSIPALLKSGNQFCHGRYGLRQGHGRSAFRHSYRDNRIEKNETAISMTKILGYDNREIASLYLVSTSIVVVISDIISVVLGAKVMDIVWRIMLQTFSGWFSFHMTPVGYVKMFAFVLIGYLIVTVFDFSRIKRIPMDMALKNVE